MAESASSHNILAPIVGAPEAAPIGEVEIEEKGIDEDWGFLEPFDPEAEADPEIVLLDDDMPLEALLETASPAPQPNLLGVPIGPSEEEKHFTMLRTADQHHGAHTALQEKLVKMATIARSRGILSLERKSWRWTTSSTAEKDIWWKRRAS